MNLMRQTLTLAAIVLAGVLITSTTARADDIITQVTFNDPATLHFGSGGGTPCATGCGGHPNLLTSSTLIDIYQNSGGAGTLVQPILLILGIPNNSSNLFGANPINSVTSYNPYSTAFPGTPVAGTSSFAAGGTYGLISPVAGGYFGIFDSSFNGDVYAFLQLQGNVNSSNNFGNWAGAVNVANGFTPTEFGIYVFAINGILSAQGLIDIDFNSTMAPGSIVIGYGQYQTTSTSSSVLTADPGCPAGYTLSGGVCSKVVGTPSQGHCAVGVKVGNTCVLQTTPTCPAGYTLDHGTCKNTVTTVTTDVKVYSTPFTEAGMTTNVPEPGTIALLSAGVLGLAALRRRRLS
jgi:hypothetical protein